MKKSAYVTITRCIDDLYDRRDVQGLNYYYIGEMKISSKHNKPLNECPFYVVCAIYDKRMYSLILRLEFWESFVVASIPFPSSFTFDPPQHNEINL